MPGGDAAVPVLAALVLGGPSSSFEAEAWLASQATPVTANATHAAATSTPPSDMPVRRARRAAAAGGVRRPPRPLGGSANARDAGAVATTDAGGT
jgi:hypothetical protein